MIEQLQLNVSTEMTIIFFIIIIFVIAFAIMKYFNIEGMDGFIALFLLVLAIIAMSVSFLSNIFYLTVIIFLVYLYFRLKPKNSESMGAEI